MRAAAVYFDAVGTVIHPRPGAVKVYAEFAKRYGVEVAEDVVRDRLITAYLAEEEADRLGGWVTSEERERERWRQIVLKCLPEVPDREACFREVFEHFALPAAWELDADVPAAFAELKGRGVPFGVASNYDARLRRVLDGYPVFRGVPALISSELGVRKPGRSFFDAVLPGMPRGCVAFIGDDFRNDYVGAADAGLLPILIDPVGRRHGVRCAAQLLEAVHYAIG